MTNTVPKIAFTYWSGDSISHLHLLTLITIRHFNPNFRVILYTDKTGVSTDDISYSSHEHKVRLERTYPFTAIYRFTDVEVIPVDFQKEYGLPSPLFHSYLADILRIKKLEEHGGLWFDMDILFLKPFTPQLLQLAGRKTVKVCSYSDTIATGLIFAAADSPSLKTLSQQADKYIAECTQYNFENTSDYKEHYQAFGPDLWRKVFHPFLENRVDQHKDACAFPPRVVYPYLWDQMPAYFEGTEPSLVSQDTIGIHWYNGSTDARTFINEGLPALYEGFEPKTPFEHDIKGLIESGVDFTPPALEDCTTSLRGCDLRGAQLDNVSFRNADLRDANLRNASLRNAILVGADLRGACLDGASLSNANLTNAVLEGVPLHKSPPQLPRFAPSPIQSTVPKQRVSISVVIAAKDRKAQLRETLRSLEKSSHSDFEVIIVDDCSDSEQSVESLLQEKEWSLSIKVITVSEKERDWKNPSGAYNLGIRFATKDVVVLQNAEVMHCGDILTFVDQHIQPRDWLTFNCYGLNPESTDHFLKLKSGHFEYIKGLPNRIGGNSVKRSDVNGWLNHLEKHFVAYHYCGAIYREDLISRMDGGFSPTFTHCVGGDDDEFVKRLIYTKFNFKIPRFTEAFPFVVHLFHEKSDSAKSWNPAEYRKTKVQLAKALGRMGFAPEIDIAHAPKSETPASRRVEL